MSAMRQDIGNLGAILFTGFLMSSLHSVRGLFSGKTTSLKAKHISNTL